MESQRPDNMSDKQYELYLQLTLHLAIPDWPRNLLNSFGTETQTRGTTRGYVAQWIRNNPLETVTEQIEAAISQACDKAWEDEETPECPNCGTLGRVTTSALGGEGCQWYCYHCCHTF